MPIKKTIKAIFAKRRHINNSNPGSLATSEPPLFSDELDLRSTTDSLVVHGNSHGSNTLPLSTSMIATGTYSLQSSLTPEVSRRDKRMRKISRFFTKRRPCSNLYQEMLQEVSLATENQLTEDNLESASSNVPGTSQSTSNFGASDDSSISFVYQSAQMEAPVVEPVYNVVKQCTEDNVVVQLRETPITDVWSFISNLKAQKVSDLSTILNLLNHHDVVNLHSEFGFNKSVLYVSIVKDFLSGKTFDLEDTFLASYCDLNEERVKDPSLYSAIEERISEIESVEKRLSETLKEKVSNCLLCLICQENMVSILFLPCGHMVICSKCNEKQGTLCQCCQSNIDECHHIFI